MSFADTIESDMADVVDDLETVTVSQVHPVTGVVATSTAGVTVLRKGETRTEAPAGRGGVAAEMRKFHLRASQLAWVPRKRDKITESDGTVWDIDSVNVATLGTRYICDTVRVRG